MKYLFNDLIDSGAWTLLRGQTEKLIVAWFATKFPQKPIQALREESLLHVAKSIGASKQKIVKESIETILRTPTFLSCYKTHQLAIEAQVSGKDSGNVSGNVSTPTKESERERESSPQTPFIEKGKGKENQQNNIGGREDDSVVIDFSEVQRESIRQHQVTQGKAMPSAWEVRQANSTKDQVVAKVEGGLKCPEAFQSFLTAYPNRWGLDSKGRECLEHTWNEVLARGWTAEAILDALAIAQKEWKLLKKQLPKGKRFIPNADKFLDEEWMRTYLPKETVAQLFNEALCETKIELFDEASFEQFCELYPDKRGLLDPDEKATVREAWRGCEARGWDGETILRALKEAMVSKHWADEAGRFVPSALRFLSEEKMRQFLPIGFKPHALQKGAVDSQSHEGMLFKMGQWWYPAEIEAYVNQGTVPERLKEVLK